MNFSLAEGRISRFSIIPRVRDVPYFSWADVPRIDLNGSQNNLRWQIVGTMKPPGMLRESEFQKATPVLKKPKAV